MKKISLIIIFSMLYSVTTMAQVSVITNKSVSDGTVSSGKLSQIYQSKVKTWGDGSKIVRFVNKNENASTNKFFGAVGVTYTAAKKIWLKQKLTGGGNPPKALDSDAAIIAKVASTPGAIGYVESANVNDQVKVILEIK